jgi:copper chaperone CopZ
MFHLNVPDMKSQRCVATIRSAVKDVDEAARCEIDLETQRVHLESPLPPSDFIEALEEVGYVSALLPFRP